MEEVIVILKIEEWKHRTLLKKIDSLKSSLRMFKINEAFKKSFMEDLFSIEGIIKQSSNRKGCPNDGSTRT